MNIVLDKSFVDEDVLKLPRVLQVEVIVSQLIFVVLEGVPFSVNSFNRADVIILDLKTLFIVHMVRLDESRLGVFQGPCHSRKDS